MRNSPKHSAVTAFFCPAATEDRLRASRRRAIFGSSGLIVTCDECTTSFELDESRIPASGARVRCSRCKHAFFLPNPSASQTEAVHDLAQEAAANPDFAGLAASEDLNESVWDGLGGETPCITESMSVAPPEPDPIPEPEVTPDAGLDFALEDEEDWQFSKDIRVEGDDLDEDLSMDLDEGLSGEVSDTIGAGASGSDLGSAGSFDNEGLDPFASGEMQAYVSAEAIDVPQISVVTEESANGGSGIRLDTDSPVAPSVEFPSMAAEAHTGPAVSRDESRFGSVDDFSSLMEDDDPQYGTIACGDAEGPSSELGSDCVGTYSGTAQSEDLGDPEGWDLVGSDDFAVSAARTDAANVIPESVDEGEFFSDAEVFDDSVYDMDLANSSLVMGPVGQLARLAGWACSAAAVLAVGYLGLVSESGRWSEAQQTVMSGPLTAQTLESNWVDTSRAGPVLRLMGELRNTGTLAVWPGSVEIALLDGEGARLTVPTIVAGVPVEESVLREAPREFLLEQAAAGSRRFAATPLAPGDVRPFEALILEARLPDKAARFELEVGEPRIAPVAFAAPDSAPTIPTSEDAASQRERQLGAYQSEP